MKCPKCGYLGFEDVERCRNCGHDFTVAQVTSVPDLSIRGDRTVSSDLLDLDLTSPSEGTSGRTVPDVTPAIQRAAATTPSTDLPLFGGGDASAEPPILQRVTPPRPPLAVRRSTPEVPRVRVDTPRTPMLDLATPDSTPATPSLPRALASASHVPAARREAPAAVADAAGLSERAMAAAIDLGILAVIDGVVIYFTLKICGLALADLWLLPKLPLAAFLALQNLGYLAAFTAGGQTLGKMTTGIRVVPVDGPTLDLGRALKRTLFWGLLAVPAGLGFATAVFNPEHRGLHDRLAGTRVIRAGAA
ncbi:MAG: RDD family protein [Vicinamibacterales bacterium]